MSRLFTFGCSFTSYFWPTWADFVGLNFDYHQNWGKPGAGNFYISSSVYECNSKHNIKEDDVVLIMFSHFNRYDSVDELYNWKTPGYIHNQKYYSKECIMQFWNEEQSHVMSWFNIFSVKNLLDTLGCNYKFMCAFNFFDFLNKKDIKNTFYKDELLKVLPTVNLKDFNVFKPHYVFDEFDDHPTVSQHLDWVKANLSEFYKPEMDEISNYWETLVSKTKKDTMNNFDSIINKSKITI